MKKNKLQKNVLSTAGALSAVLLLTSCSNKSEFFKASVVESAVIAEPVFKTNFFGPQTDILHELNANEHSDVSDSFLPANIFKEEKEKFDFVESCDPLKDEGNNGDLVRYIKKVAGDTGVTPADGSTSYEFEKAVVEKLVEERINEIKTGSNLPLLIPVEYVFTTGDKHDAISNLAYKRSILRKDHSGETIVQTAGSTIYVTDHNKARTDFINGKMKYFSVVEVKDVKNDYNQVYSEKFNIPGISTWSVYQAHTLSGLTTVASDYISHFTTTGLLPVANIFIADIRNQTVPALADKPFMYDDVSTVGRNNEVVRYLKDTFNLKQILKHRNEVIAAFSEDRTVESFSYKGYEGLPRLVHRLTCESKSARLTTSYYTPIIFDLGKRHVRTTSDDWGTYFNVANGRTFIDGFKQEHEGENTYSHKTAWVGGYLEKIANPLGAGKPDMWSRVAEDGFLVLPKKDEIHTSEQLFGSAFVNPKNPEAKYKHGFEALQDYAGTKVACATPVGAMEYKGALTDDVLKGRYAQIKERYVGPWSESYKELKVWVDRNMNGSLDKDELKGLQESGILAINTCLVNNADFKEKDQYGNMTTLRTAFYYDTDLASKALEDSQITDVLKTVATGQKGNKPAEFRLMIDVYFKGVTSDFLERSQAYRSAKLGKPVEIKIDGVNIQNPAFTNVASAEEAKNK